MRPPKQCASIGDGELGETLPTVIAIGVVRTTSPFGRWRPPQYSGRPAREGSADRVAPRSCTGTLPRSCSFEEGHAPDGYPVYDSIIALKVNVWPGATASQAVDKRKLRVSAQHGGKDGLPLITHAVAAGDGGTRVADAAGVAGTSEAGRSRALGAGDAELKAKESR